jgi:hypothetical protein
MRRIALVSLLFVTAGAACAAPHASRLQAHSKKLAGYKVIVVNAFTIDENAAAKAPRRLDETLHARAVQELQAKAIFDAVVDAAPATSESAAGPVAPLDLRVGAVSPDERSAAPTQKPQNIAGAGRRVVLDCVVLSFSKGNRAARYVAGFGAGESKLKVRFTLTDAKTGAEVMSWDQAGSFKGMFTPFGGSVSQATKSEAGGVMKGLIKQIEENR